MRCEGGACPRKRVQNLPGIPGSATATATAVIITPTPCPSGPHVPWEIPWDRHLVLSCWSSALQPGDITLEEGVWGVRVSSPGLGQEGCSSALHLHSEMGQSSGAIMVYAVAAHAGEQPRGEKLSSGFHSQLCHMFFT